MQYRKSAIAVIAALAATLTVATPASAAWGGHGGWHGRGVGLGFATGAIVGSALAAPYYYGGYGYAPYAYDGGYDNAYAAAPSGYGYGPYAYDEGYGYDDAYAAASGYDVDRDDQSCAQRFKSYDPSSGTYLGYDGARHPCP
jgi:hypothetical protein